MQALWHPFANMAAVNGGGQLSIERGEGVHVWDGDGNRYIDATAGLWFCNVGYGRREIAEAVDAQIRRLHTYHTFGDVSNRPAAELAERIAAVAPVPGSKVFLTSGGSDSIDSAAKLARRYWHLVGEPGRTVMITRHRAYHGMHAYGTSIAGVDANLADLGPMIGDVVTVPWDSARAVADAIGEAGPERVAAFFCEPVIGAGGVLAPPEGYLKEVQETCREAGVLFIADEVVTGFGRVGDWFASGRFGLEPDILVFAKGVTSGYLPLGGIIVSPTVAEPFWRAPGVMWRHGYTYSGHATACAAALANIAVLEAERIPEYALRLEGELEEALEPLGDHDLVAEVRSGTGVLAAVQIDPDAVAADPDLPGRVVAAARRSGVLTRNIVGDALQVSPPLILDRAGLAEIASGLGAALNAA